MYINKCFCESLILRFTNDQEDGSLKKSDVTGWKEAM